MSEEQGLETVEELAEQLAEVTRLSAVLRERKTEIENRLGALMEAKRVEVHGIGPVERYKRKTRKAWDHEALQRTLYRKAMSERVVDEETGEVLSEAEVVFRLLTETANPSWRTTALKANDIDPDEFAETVIEPGWAIRLPVEATKTKEHP
ncbi:hypothetical protein [Kocuria rosea]|uniref:hypothetical protein n=1 Tax=Kocuria rosea TaxID=1275 RepID=UPI0011A5DB2C|nr:hypothetical protein [Kocuria rosea]